MSLTWLWLIAFGLIYRLIAGPYLFADTAVADHPTDDKAESSTDNGGDDGDDTDGDGDDGNDDAASAGVHAIGATDEDTDLDGMHIEESHVKIQSKESIAKETKKEREQKEPAKDDEDTAEAEDKAKHETKEVKKAAAPEPDLITKAADYGIPKEEAEKLDGDSLKRRMVDLDRQLAAMGGKILMTGGQTQTAQAPSQTQQTQQTPTGQTQSPAPAGQTQSAAASPSRYSVKLKREQWDPEIVGELESIAKHVDDQLDQIRESVGKVSGGVDGMRQAEEARQLHRTIELFDSEFSKLGSDWEDLAGKGSFFDQAPDSDTRKFRMNVAANASAIYQALRQTTGKDQPISFDALFRRAINAVAGDKTLDIERKKIAKTLDKRRGATVNRPTQRQRDLPPGDARALANLRTQLEKLGATGEGDEEDDLE